MELSKQIIRGKVDFYISEEQNSNLFNNIIDKESFKIQYNNIKSITDELGVSNKTDIVSLVFEYLLSAQTKEGISAQDWEPILKGIHTAIDLLNKFRVQEGETLKHDISMRINKILKLLDEIELHESQRINRIKDRINTNFNIFIDANKIDQNRFEQEIIYYIERLDITEEKVRLKTHCNYFLEILSEPNSEGKKLGFIAQEIGREINTLGSKANDINIQKIVVNMKDELEKIKEQLSNIL
jgi:uncharacterized protein (TIGR00255 family)